MVELFEHRGPSARTDTSVQTEPSFAAHEADPYIVVAYPFTESQITRIDLIRELLDQTDSLLSLPAPTEEFAIDLMSHPAFQLFELKSLFKTQTSLLPTLKNDEPLNQALYTEYTPYTYELRRIYQYYEMAYRSIKSILSNADSFPSSSYVIASVRQVLIWFGKNMQSGL